MASNLLKTFEKIDNHRKALIQKANSSGANLSNDASFLDIVPHVGADVTPTYPEYKHALNTEDWVRPAEWPDCKDILENAEEKDGLKPGIIMLLDATHSDELILPKYAAGSSTPYLYNGVDAGNVCASGYLMSDGTWYGDMTNEITHTWDTSKDIIVDSGKYPGRYRWIILYYTSARSISYVNFVRFPAVEVILGNIAYSGTVNYFGGFITYNTYGDDTMSKYLKHVEFLPTFSVPTIGWSWGQSRYFMACMQKLEHITCAKQITMGSVGNSELFCKCSFLRHINLVDGLKYSQQHRISDCKSLVTYKGSVNYLVLSGDYLQLEQVDTGGYSCMISGYAPETAKIKSCPLYGATLPISWKTQGGFKFEYSNQSNGVSNGRFFWNNRDITRLDFSFVDKFYSVSSVLDSPQPTYAVYSSGVVAQIGKNSYNLKEIIWPSIVKDRISIGDVVLYKYSVIELLENLVDITNLDVKYNNVWLHPYNYDELSDEEIAIATNKGWEVVRGWPY